MNKVILMGRLTRDPEIRYSQGERSTAVARYSLAVNRTFKRDGDPILSTVLLLAVRLSSQRSIFIRAFAL